MPHISIIAPVYKSAGALQMLYEALVEAVTPITGDFEILLIDDHCPENSWATIRKLAATDPRVRGVRLARNFGQHNAITAGLDLAEGDWVVVMDADLQDHPRHIPTLYRKAVEGWPMVAVRWNGRKDPLGQRLAARFFYWLLSGLTGAHFDPLVGNFRIMSRQAVLGFRRYREQSRSFVAICNLMGFDTAYVEADRELRRTGRSSYTWSKRIKLAMDIVVAHSDKPLRFSIGLGLSIAGLAFLIGSGLLLRALLFGTSVAGWTSIIVSTYFLGGVIIAHLGLLGLYLGRTFDEAKARPIYLVGETTSSAPLTVCGHGNPQST